MSTELLHVEECNGQEIRLYHIYDRTTEEFLYLDADGVLVRTTGMDNGYYSKVVAERILELIIDREPSDDYCLVRGAPLCKKDG